MNRSGVDAQLVTSTTAALVAIAARGAWRVADHLAVRDRVASVTSRSPKFPVMHRWIELRLSLAAIALPVRDAVYVWMAVPVVVALLVCPLKLWFGCSLALATFAAAPMLLWTRRNRRDVRAAQALPDLLRSVASALRAGETVRSAIADFAESDTALATQIATLHDRIELGATLEDALTEWRRESAVAGVATAAGALTLAARLGGPAAVPLDGLADSLGERFEQRSELRAQSAQSRASALVMVLAPVGFVVFSSAVDSRSLNVLIGTAVGRVCLAIGAMLDTLAWLWMRYLLRDRISLA